MRGKKEFFLTCCTMTSPANDTGEDQPHHKNNSSSHEKSKVLILGGLCRGGDVHQFLLLRSLRHAVEMQIDNPGMCPHLNVQLCRTYESVLSAVPSNQNICDSEQKEDATLT